MKKVVSLIIVILACFLPIQAKSTVEVEISSLQMLIGHQVKIKLSALTQDTSSVKFPVYKPLDMITPGIEVINSEIQSPEKAEDGFYRHSCIYTITSFDDTLYYIPPFKVGVDGKEIESESLALKVLTVDVDTTNVDKFYGPKGVQDNPFSWNDWKLIFILSVVFTLLAVLIFFLYLRLKDNKPIVLNIKVVKKLLPHQKAMNAIERIKADKMVVSENQKEYYTQLTETLRKYIEERYGFNAMEMTSSEIIERLSATKDMTAIEELRTLFNTADLVKFAKHSTLINENDMNLVNAIEFINTTKIENMPDEEIVAPQLSEEQERTILNRRVLYVVILLGVLAMLSILTYVLRELYMLM